MREITKEMLFKLVPHIANGIKRGNIININDVDGIESSLIERISSLMKADEYDGSFIFYVCEKLADIILDDIRVIVKASNIMKTELPTDIISYVKEKNIDILLCALMGAIIQAANTEDSLEEKCLEIMNQKYVSALSERRKNKVS